MGLVDTLTKPFQKTANWVDSKVTQLPNWLEKPAQLGLLMTSGGLALRGITELRNALGYNQQGGEFKAQDMWYSPQGFTWPEFAMAEFTPVEPMGEINVNALLDEMTGINRKTTAGNFEIAQTMGRKVADNAFTDFAAFLDKIMPEANQLTRSVAKEAQNFISRGLPSAVMGNAILRDSAMFNATGTRGDVAVRKGLANEAARDTQAVQYGMGVAQQLVNDARSTALPFAQLGVEATQNNLGLLTQLTTITPAQRVGMAFDERNYQTGVAQFNAGTAAGVSQFNAGQANSMAQFNSQMDFQNMQFQTELGMQQELLREQQRQAQKSSQAAMYSLLGTVGGAAAGLALAPATGGASLAFMSAGAGIGGGLGQMYGGSTTGNTGLMASGLGSMTAGAGAYSAWNTQQQTLQMQNQYLSALQSSTGARTSWGTPVNSWNSAYQPSGQPMWR